MGLNLNRLFLYKERIIFLDLSNRFEKQLMKLH